MTILFPPETISETMGNGGRDDVIELLFSRISETTLEEFKYTTSVAASRKRNISPYSSAHFFVKALAPNGGKSKLFPTIGHPLGPGGNRYLRPCLSRLGREKYEIPIKIRRANCHVNEIIRGNNPVGWGGKHIYRGCGGSGSCRRSEERRVGK